MTTKWTNTQLSEVIRLVRNRIQLHPAILYKRLTVRMNAQGVVLRDIVEGDKIRTEAQYAAHAGQFILSKIDARNGAFGLVPENLDGSVVSGNFLTFDCLSDRLLPKFLGLYASRAAFWDECQRISEGTTNRVPVRVDQFMSLTIPLPPLEDQQRIIAKLEELATQIDKAKLIRDKAARHVEALIPSMLSAEFDYEPHTDLPVGWKWEPLCDLLSNTREGMMTGPFGTLLQKSETQSAGVPILGISNVQPNQFVSGFTDFISNQKAAALSSYKLNPGDIVIARSGTVGRSCVVPDGIDPAPIMSTNLIRLRLNQDVFLSNLMCRLFNGSRLVESYKEAECRGSTRTFFTQRILLRLQIPVPPINEQQRIIEKLNDLQSQVDAIKHLQAKADIELNALLPSILDKAFKGEL